jgi:hypothetical protein
MPSDRIYIEVVEHDTGEVIKKIDVTGLSLKAIQNIEDDTWEQIDKRKCFVRLP